MIAIAGTVAPGWEGVQAAFAANFDERGEVGAALCVYLGGVPVVDVWGGVADRRTGRRWERDTIVGVFSSTKDVTAVGANLAIERGFSILPRRSPSTGPSSPRKREGIDHGRRGSEPSRRSAAGRGHVHPR